MKQRNIMSQLCIVLAFSAIALVTQAEQDHSFLIHKYDGAKTCEVCHPGTMAEIMKTVHYKFESPVPENYLFDEKGNPLDIEESGKFWKLCGFPTTFPQFNWMGKLKDDPVTPHIDVPGGCGRCHIGIGIKPFTASNFEEPQANESNNIDCLVCHAKNYQRKFYVATRNGEPDLKPDGTPYVFSVPRVDGEFDFSIQLEAAQTVGHSPTSEACLRCHASAGGGKYELDNMEYNFKRGSAFDKENDVHARAGMTCVNCHSAGNHQTKRPLNNDAYAYDNVVDHQMCTDCHTDTPHKLLPMYNLHTSFISCTGCHATSTGGARFKDFSMVVPADPNNPLALNKVELRLQSSLDGNESNIPFNFINYLWFNGQVHGEIQPVGSREDGKIYPYKTAGFNQPVDANGHPIPVKWGLIFLKGDVMAAVSKGRELYTSMFSDELAAEKGIPTIPGEFDHFATHYCNFSISHGITKEKALTCENCHTEDTVLDYAKLGYSPQRTEQLMTLDLKEFDTVVEDWTLFE